MTPIALCYWESLTVGSERFPAKAHLSHRPRCVVAVFPNSPISQKAKPYYLYGEQEEFQCYVGFDLEGFQFINCLPGGVWSQPQGECLRKSAPASAIHEGFSFIQQSQAKAPTCCSSGVPGKVCLPPDLPDGMTVHPMRDEYRVGQSVGFSCDGAGLVPVPSSRHTCGQSLTWEPPLPEDLRCSDGTVERSSSSVTITA